MGFRLPIAQWTIDNLSRFDVLEITVDHYIYGGDRVRGIFRELSQEIAFVAHGVGLSLGTDVPLDEAYLEQVARTVDDLKMPVYSEHLAWTKAPGIDLANLLPLPKTEPVAESIVAKVKRVQEVIPVPFALENISYVFEFPDSVLTDAQFFNLIFRETGATMLLDVENLYVNSANHKFDPLEFMAALPPGIVTGVHLAGGPLVSRHYLEEPVWVDGHNAPVHDEALALLNRVLDDHNPDTIILERDDGLEDEDDIEEISRDIDRIRAYVDARFYGKVLPDAESHASRPSA
jgi:uncharacterized protein (UPF0276 family)